MSWSERDVEVGDGVVLHVYRQGTGPSLVLAHGMLDDGACWTRVAEALEPDFDLIAYDARYHGLTHEPADAAWGGAADLVALADALDLERPFVMGHSMGAATTVAAIAEHPARFRAAVLEDPPWFGGSFDAAMGEERRAMFEEMLAGSEADIEATGRQFSPTWADEEFGPWARAKRRFRGADRLSGIGATLANPWQGQAACFEIPVLLVCGGDEVKGRIVSPAVASEAASICPTLEVATFAEAGHNVRREAFDGYVAAVREFLGRVAG